MKKIYEPLTNSNGNLESHTWKCSENTLLAAMLKCILRKKKLILSFTFTDLHGLST